MQGEKQEESFLKKRYKLRCVCVILNQRVNPKGDVDRV